MFLKNFFKWFDETKCAKREGSDREDRTLECSLIRSFSEFNQKDLKHHKLSSDFHSRLLTELNQIQPDPQTIENKVKNAFDTPYFTYTISFAGLVVFLTIILSGFIQPTKIDKFDLNLETAMVEDEDLDELDVLTDLKKVQEDIDLLQKLEKYYTIHGNIEKADRVHYKLETISR